MTTKSMPQIERLFLSVGAMKAGTTWLYDKLRQHPEIYFTPQKEVHYFAHYYGKSAILDASKREIRAANALAKAGRVSHNSLNLVSITNWYSRYKIEPVNYEWLHGIMEQGINSNQYVSDFSNLTCFLDTNDWSDVKRHTKKLRVVYILRDPLSRLWSHFKFHLQFSKHNNAHKPDNDFSLFKRIIDKPWFWRNALYSKQIKALQSSLKQEELKILFFEDMVSNPKDFLHTIEGFLDIQSADYDGSLYEKKNKSIEREFPKEWKRYAQSLLATEVITLKQIGFWHQGWEEA